MPWLFIDCLLHKLHINFSFSFSWSRKMQWSLICVFFFLPPRLQSEWLPQWPGWAPSRILHVGPTAWCRLRDRPWHRGGLQVRHVQHGLTEAHGNALGALPLVWVDSLVYDWVRHCNYALDRWSHHWTSSYFSSLHSKERMSVKCLPSRPAG